MRVCVARVPVLRVGVERVLFCQVSFVLVGVARILVVKANQVFVMHMSTLRSFPWRGSALLGSSLRDLVLRVSSVLVCFTKVDVAGVAL